MAGYDVKNTNVYMEKSATALKQDQLRLLLCSFCGLVLRTAVQVTACGHRFCKDCIDTLTTHSSSEGYRCPVDDERFERAEVKTDRGCQKEISSLEVDCPTTPNPCMWRGPLVQIEVHTMECPNSLVNCSLKCGLTLTRKELNTHITNECTKRLVPCIHCSNKVTADSMELHSLECEEFPVTCSHCQLNLLSRNSLKKHLRNECEKCELSCPLNCSNFKGDRSSMNAHLKSHLLDMVHLLNSALSSIESLKALQQESDNTMNTLTRRLEETDREKKAVLERVSELEDVVENWKASGNSGKSQLRNPPETAHTHRNDLLQSLSPNGASVVRWGGLGMVEREEAGMREVMGLHETQLMQMSETVHTVQSHLTQQSVAMDDLRLRQDILDVKVTNGVLIWKIPDIRRRYRDALDGRTISLYSPPFYTSPHGYRMCIRVYLNGDGAGKGTHVSLFFVVMRSEHDNLLSWPFKQSVRFTLINQKNPSASIKEAFSPDVSSSSFKKPLGEMNVASGFPKFARQSVLQDEEVTMGNTIFIKCQVDTAGLKLE